VVLVAGWVVRRAALGADAAGMWTRVESEVRSSFDQMTRRLREMALAVADRSAGTETDNLSTIYTVKIR
jgi:hypothetical protein